MLWASWLLHFFALLVARIFCCDFLTHASLVTAFRLFCCLTVQTVSTLYWSPSVVINTTILCQKSFFFSLWLMCIFKNCCFDFCCSRWHVLSCLFATLTYGITFCAFFIMRRSDISLDLLVLQVILVSLDNGINYILNFFKTSWLADLTLALTLVLHSELEFFTSYCYFW